MRDDSSTARRRTTTTGIVETSDRIVRIESAPDKFRKCGRDKRRSREIRADSIESAAGATGKTRHRFGSAMRLHGVQSRESIIPGFKVASDILPPASHPSTSFPPPWIYAVVNPPLWRSSSMVRCTTRRSLIIIMRERGKLDTMNLYRACLQARRIDSFDICRMDIFSLPSMPLTTIARIINEMDI